MKLSKYLFPLAFILLLGCFADTNDAHNPNRLDSDHFPESTERIQKLGQQIKSFSKIKDAEFELFNVNGFANSRASSVPGASSWNYKFVVKVEPSDLPKWRSGFILFIPENYDDSWTKKITSVRRENWITTSTPKYYKRKDSNVTMIIYEDEGFVFKQVIAD